MFFNKKLTNYRITSNLQKNLLFEKAGVDFVIVSRFNKSFSKISADNFIKKIIVKKINPNFIFVSNNFKYGFRRAGNVAKLISKENIYNYKIIKPSPLKKRKKIISSTLIRKLLQKGELKNANKLLGRNWSIIGVVQKGRRIGKKLGVPTCNIDIKNYVIAKPGVYSVRVKVNNSNKIFKGIANLGYRPTFGEKKILLEVNLFNFSGNLYNKSLNVSFCNFIRSEKKFNDHQDLIKQIEKDLKQAKFDLKKNNE
jgi:riboflavin kinase/FMN adenylyltransferase